MSQAACILGVAGFGWLTVFQLMLAAGLPLGYLSWGGAHRVLPSRLRILSLFSAVLTLLGAVVVAQAGGLVSVLPPAWIAPLLWVYAALFAVSFLLNLFGANGLERLHGVPLTILCAGSCLVLAFG